MYARVRNTMVVVQQNAITGNTHLQPVCPQVVAPSRVLGVIESLTQRKEIIQVDISTG